MRTFGQKAWALIFIGLLTALACESPTPVAPAESGLSVSANPTRIGVDGESEITVIARKSDGSAVNEGTEINFSTTLGTISPTIATTNDRGIATSTLRGDGRVGLATVEVSSGAATPVPIDIQIGSQPVVIQLNSSTDRISKEGGSVDLVAIVSDDLNNTVPDARVTFSTEAGTLVDEAGNPDAGAVTTNADGEARKGLVLTAFEAAGVDDGIFEVSAETVGTEGPISDVIDIEVAGFVQDILVQANPSTIPITGAQIEAFATVFDDSGDTVEGVGVVFETDVGTTSSPGRQMFTDADGVAMDIITVTALDLDALPPAQTSFLIRASAPGLGSEFVEGSTSVAISTSVGTLFLEAVPATVDCETAATVELRATVIDQNNLPAENVSVNFGYNSTVTPGVISPTTVFTGADGIATSFLTISAAVPPDPPDLPCDAMTGTVINSFTVRADTFLLGEPVESVFTIGVNFP